MAAMLTRGQTLLGLTGHWKALEYIFKSTESHGVESACAGISVSRREKVT